MESPELILCKKDQRVTIFSIPPLSTSKGYYLDDWKDMIWEGGVRVTEKNKIIKVTFVDKTGKIFAETTLPSNPREAVVKTLDSSRGYAIRLQNPKGGFLWVGVGFRDRTDAFDFGATLQDYSDRTKMDANPNSLKEQFGEKIDFSLKKGEKVKIQIGGMGNKGKNKSKEVEGEEFASKESQSNSNQFGNFDFDLTQKPPVNKTTSKKQFNFDPTPKTKKESAESFNLLDL